MAVIETKYSVGDKVFFAGTTTERKQHPCPDCRGEKHWHVTSPAGGEYKVACPRCSSRFMSDTGLSLDYTAHVPSVRRLTIGSVQFNSAVGSYDSGARYMCIETGVGSGSVYDEANLFQTEQEALTASEVMAKLANTEIGWVVKLYDKTLEISDYQIEHAKMVLANQYRSEIGSLFWNVSDLFDAIEEAGDMDAILELVDDYKRFTWERDKERFAAQGMEARSDEIGTGSARQGDSPVTARNAP